MLTRNGARHRPSALLRYVVSAWDWRLLLSILLFLGLPNVYELYRIHLIGGASTGAEHLAIVSQWQFVELAAEVFREATTLAIFFFVGSQLRKGATTQRDRWKSVFALVLVASVAFSLFLFLFREAFIVAIGTPEDIRLETQRFLGISIFSIPFTTLAAATLVMFESLRLWRQVLYLALAQVGLRFAFDSLFFGSHPFSLEAGALGWAWSSLLASIGVFALGVVLMAINRKLPLGAFKTPPSFTDVRQYLRVGFGSGVESLVRNLAYAVMVVRVINTLGAEAIAGYYVAIQMLWSFMLLPVLALADSAKALVANAANDIQLVRKVWQASMVITAPIVLLWIAIAPLLPAAILWLSDDAEVAKWALEALTMLLLPYMLLAFNIVVDSVFYGTGKTKYMAYQAIVTNGTVYLGSFVLYASGAWQPTFAEIILLFTLGIIVDTLLTAYFLRRVLYAGRRRFGRA